MGTGPMAYLMRVIDEQFVANEFGQCFQYCFGEFRVN